jgi:hypothetical protein
VLRGSVAALRTFHIVVEKRERQDETKRLQGQPQASMRGLLCIVVTGVLLVVSNNAFAPILPRQHSALQVQSPSTAPPTSTTTALFGIPKMFRWLTDQYPNINRRINEGLSETVGVNHFYLDMNGIIHPCTHGNAEGEIIVLDETLMFKKIFLYVDR